MWKKSFFSGIIILLLISLILPACNSRQEASQSVVTAESPEWFGYELTDVQTGETFTMNDYAGKVVLLETMAIWCPNCLFQAGEVRKMHEMLGNPEDLISVSLDVDVNEDAPALKDYSEEWGFEWHFAIAPLEVARALGNLYNAEYLNPPLSPMLIIDRDGGVHHLEYGKKSAETLMESVEPFLNP